MANINAFWNQVKPDGLQTTRGIGQEVIQEMHKMGGLGQSSYEQDEYQIEDGELAHSYAIDPEIFKFVTLKMVVEAGVKVLFHTYFSDVIMEGNILKGIMWKTNPATSNFRESYH